MFDLVPFRRRGDDVPATRIEREVNDLFQRFMGDLWTPMTRRISRSFTPTVDISETDTDVIVTAEVPGMTADDFTVDLSGDILTIRGEKKTESEETGKHYHRVERSYGSFCRSFTLPDYAKADSIDASYKDGILTLKIPKEEKALPKAIPIKVRED
jgi:HSP20 family protein